MRGNERAERNGEEMQGGKEWEWNEGKEGKGKEGTTWKGGERNGG